MQNTRRIVTNYAVSRKQKRFIARRNMKVAGKRKVAKHSYKTFDNKGVTRLPSFFAENWRDFITMEDK